MTNGAVVLQAENKISAGEPPAFSLEKKRCPVLFLQKNESFLENVLSVKNFVFL